MNIAEILKDCPEGTKLWSPICGDCTLLNVDLSLPHPIQTRSSSGTELFWSFTKNGNYLSSDAGECLLFPSKGNRDWTKFNQNNYKPGDFVYLKTEYDWVCLFRERRDGMVCTFLSYDPENQGIYGLGDDWNRLCYEEEIRYSRLATEQEKVEFLKALDKEGYSWDAENLKKVVKKAYKFKPFQKVLVRDGDGEKWRADIFSHKEDDEYSCIGCVWAQCLPYEGNEHLLGTTENVK